MLSLLSGMLWALVAAGLIYLGSTLLTPRIPRGRIWADWRRRRVVWALSLLGGFASSYYTAEAICRRWGFVDLYWLGQKRTLLLIALTGGPTGYLLMLGAITVGSLWAQRKAKTATRPNSRRAG